MSIQWTNEDSTGKLKFKSLKDLPTDTPFRLIRSARRIWLKVKPTGAILNSNIVIDVLNRADCFVVSLDSPCTMMFMPGDREIIPVDLRITDCGDSK